MSFQISSVPLEQLNLSAGFDNPQAGAFACFEGRVRDQNDGKGVIALEYEAQAPLCQSEAEKIFAEAGQRFQILSVKTVHRTGRLNVGEMAVWVGVLAAHRADAFAACRYIIDELKSRLPIWKKEHYGNGESEWINCQSSADVPQTANLDDLKYHEKQIKLPEIGLAGQEKIRQTKVLVVGAGGLGTAALTSLVTSGFGTIGICEFDKLELSNIARQPLYSPQDVGRPKLDLAVQALQKLNPSVRFKCFPEKLSPENIGLLDGFDIVLDCTDNFTTKFLLNDACYLKKKILVQASIYQYEGHLRVFHLRHSHSCLRCLWPDIPDAECTGTCSDVGVVGAVPQILGHLQAFEALKIVCNLPGQLYNQMLMMDLLNYRIKLVAELRNMHCPLCSEQASIQDIEPQRYEKKPKTVCNRCIDISEIPRGHLGQYVFVDVRENFERMTNPVKDVESLHWPMSQCSPEMYQLEQNRQYLIFCEKGIRSEFVVNELHARGWTNTYSINGGISQIQNYIKA